MLLMPKPPCIPSQHRPVILAFGTHDHVHKCRLVSTDQCRIAGLDDDDDALATSVYVCGGACHG